MSSVCKYFYVIMIRTSLFNTVECSKNMWIFMTPFTRRTWHGSKLDRVSEKASREVVFVVPSKWSEWVSLTETWENIRQNKQDVHSRLFGGSKRSLMACSRISKMRHWDTYALLYFISLYFHFGLLAIFFFKFSFVQNCLYFVLKDIFTTYRISGWQWFSFPFLTHHGSVFWLSSMLPKSQLSVLLLLHWRGCVFRVCGVSFLFFYLCNSKRFIYLFICLFVL